MTEAPSHAGKLVVGSSSRLISCTVRCKVVMVLRSRERVFLDITHSRTFPTSPFSYPMAHQQRHVQRPSDTLSPLELPTVLGTSTSSRVIPVNLMPVPFGLLYQSSCATLPRSKSNVSHPSLFLLTLARSHCLMLGLPILWISRCFVSVISSLSFQHLS